MEGYVASAMKTVLGNGTCLLWANAGANTAYIVIDIDSIVVEALTLVVSCKI